MIIKQLNLTNKKINKLYMNIIYIIIMILVFKI